MDVYNLRAGSFSAQTLNITFSLLFPNAAWSCHSNNVYARCNVIFINQGVKHAAIERDSECSSGRVWIVKISSAMVRAHSRSREEMKIKERMRWEERRTRESWKERQTVKREYWIISLKINREYSHCGVKICITISVLMRKIGKKYLHQRYHRFFQRCL